MKIFSFEKYRSVRDNILNIVLSHPRLTGIFVAFGLSFTFAYVGRFALHEVLALASNSFQIDYVDKTPISESFRFVQHADAIPCCFCDACGASGVAPGHEGISPGDAKDFAPGELSKSPGDAQNLAPGHLKK